MKTHKIPQNNNKGKANLLHIFKFESRYRAHQCNNIISIITKLFSIRYIHFTGPVMQNTSSCLICPLLYCSSCTTEQQHQYVNLFKMGAGMHLGI